MGKAKKTHDAELSQDNSAVVRRKRATKAGGKRDKARREVRKPKAVR